MSKQNANYFSFLLRAWRDHEGASWRFSLEGAQSGEQLRFTELEGLVAFLQDQMGVETVVETTTSSADAPPEPLAASDEQPATVRSTRRRRPRRQPNL